VEVAESTRSFANQQTLFALTRAVPFFQRFGSTVTEDGPFLEKVWRDCRTCPLRERCTELAVSLKL
jgi:amino-acid N-acetyltransferase